MTVKDAFICDAIRTPIGRYGGALAVGAHRRPRRAADPGADGAQPERRLGGGRRRLLRLRQPGRRGQPQRRAHGGAARRAAGSTCRARRSTGCAAPGSTRSRIAARTIRCGEAELAIAGGVESMSRAPFVLAKADERVLARGEDRGHDDRLALRQPADEGAVRHRLDARDRRERRRRATASRAPTRTPSRCARSSARSPRRPPACLAQEIVPVPDRRRRRATPSSSTATSIRARPRSRRSRS